MLLVAGSGLVNGQPQNALNFDGVDDYVNCGNDASLNITGPITIEAWIRIDDVIQQFQRIVEKDWATSYFLGSSYGTDGIAFCMDANGNGNNVLQTSDDILYQFIWTHVAGTWDGTTMRIYVNGDEVASKPWINVVTGSSNNVLLGKYYGNSTQNFKGKIDEVRIWNTARTATQLRENMYKQLENPGLESNLVAYYRFNQGSGQTVLDWSPNSNTGILGGTVAIETSDPTWVASNVPLPYKTKQDGIWYNVNTWQPFQGWPFKAWAIVEIDHEVTLGANAVSGYLTVNPGGALTINSGNTLTVSNTFTIKSDEFGTGSFIDNGTVISAGNTIERYFEDDDWHLVSSPVSGAQAGIFTGMYLQGYNESTAMWNDIVNVNTPLNVMQGYALWIPTATAMTAEFSGTLNTGSQSMGFTADNAFGWNLLGNPYPSSIDWDLVVPNANMNSAVYYLDAASGNYVSYVGGVGASRYIPPMQGFWISATGNGSLSFDNNHRTHIGSDTYYKSDVDDLVVIKATGNGLEDKLYIRFNDEATADFDGSQDAWKLIGEYNSALPQIFSYSNDQMLSIDTRPATNLIPAGFNSLNSGEFTLSLGDNNGFTSVYVEDLLTGTLTDLMAGDYTFNYNVGEEDARFVLHFAALSVDDNPAASSYNIWACNGKIFIDSEEQSNSEMFLYDLTGRLVKTSELNGGVNMITVDQTGNYIVKVAGEKGVVANKVFIK